MDATQQLDVKSKMNCWTILNKLPFQLSGLREIIVTNLNQKKKPNHVIHQKKKKRHNGILTNE